ncbi:MAG: lipase family protein [Candidatus Kariarchaeaceae archaeon]
MSEPEFDYDLALKLLNLSLEAYREGDAFQNKFVGLTKLAHINDLVTDTQLFILTDETTNELFIAFRGTSNISDLFTEVIAFKEKYPKDGNNSKLFPMKVHRGALKAYLTVKDKILEIVGKEFEENSITRVHTTGHSQGGAMATICAFDIKYKFPDLELVMYNYGSIRTGNLAFAKKFNKLIPNTYRIVNNEDFSARHPKLFYKHVGKLVFISRNKLRVNPSRFFQFLENLDNPIGIATGQAVFDHVADKYRIVMKDMEEVEKGKLYKKKRR